MAVVLNQYGPHGWDDFRAALVEAVRGGGPDYYENWLSALQGLLEDSGLVTADEVAARASEYQALLRDPVF